MTKEKFNNIVDYIRDITTGTEFYNHIYVVGGACRNLYMGREIKEHSPQHMKMFSYKLPVDGNDIMEILKIEPGEIISKINKRLLNHAFINPDITRDECIKILPGIKKEAETYIMKNK